MENTRYALSLLKIPVSDIKQGIKFYLDTLGFEFQFGTEEFGWARFQAGPIPLLLYKPGMGGGDGKIGGSVGFHLSLPPGPFDSIADDLHRVGVLVDNKIHRGDDVTTFIEVCDPDGNILHLMRGETDN